MIIALKFRVSDILLVNFLKIYYFDYLIEVLLSNGTTLRARSEQKRTLAQ